MSPEASRHRWRIGGLLAAGKLPWDYRPEKSVSKTVCAVCRNREVPPDRSVCLICVPAGAGDAVRAAAEEMLAELLGDFANGVANGYFPEVGAKLDRWCDALGKPRVVRYQRDVVAD